MIKASITPRMAQDQGGTLCLPLVRNLGNPLDALAKHPDWRIVKCPSCGESCYQSDAHRQAMTQDSSIVALCTMCALRAGTGVL